MIATCGVESITDENSQRSSESREPASWVPHAIERKALTIKKESFHIRTNYFKSLDLS
jgi:hypothetical protein